SECSRSDRTILGSSSPLPPGQWFDAAFEGLAHLRGREASFDGAGIVGRELEAEETTAQLLGDCQGRAATAEGVEDSRAGVRAAADDPAQKLLGGNPVSEHHSCPKR